MKKLFISALAVFSFVCCSNAARQEVTANSEVEKSSEKAVKSNATDNQPTSVDLASLELKGRVKTVVTKEHDIDVTYTFDKKGKLVSVKDCDSEYDISYYNDGELSIFAPDYGTTYYALDPETNRLVMSWGTEGGCTFNITYNYDNDTLKSLTITTSDEDEEETTEEVKVKIISVDEQGNWTKRTLNDYTEERTITYY
ncbi:MAG: hypothetical protein J5805_02160 [Bacteroidaceae bacterium]|nr:hypothetical protein [Bacteroidaceae bacterium]